MSVRCCLFWASSPVYVSRRSGLQGCEARQQNSAVQSDKQFLKSNLNARKYSTDHSDFMIHYIYSCFFRQTKIWFRGHRKSTKDAITLIVFILYFLFFWFMQKLNIKKDKSLGRNPLVVVIIYNLLVHYGGLDT